MEKSSDRSIQRRLGRITISQLKPVDKNKKRIPAKEITTKEFTYTIRVRLYIDTTGYKRQFTAKTTKHTDTQKKQRREQTGGREESSVGGVSL